MRNEKEIFDTIIKVANEDENIQAVVLNGSRANEFDFLYPEESENSILKHLEYLKSNLSL